MSGDEPSELPQHYGSKPLDGELIRRPVTPPALVSPRCPYNPNPRAFSPERAPVDIHQHSDPEVPRTSGGLRRRPSGHASNLPPSRRWPGGEDDRERLAFSSIETSSRKAQDQETVYIIGTTTTIVTTHRVHTVINTNVQDHCGRTATLMDGRRDLRLPLNHSLMSPEATVIGT